MPNLYGVANAPCLLAMYNLIGAADIATSPGVETNVIDTGLLVAPSQGWFYPIAWCSIAITLGASVPGAITMGIRVNNGADLGTTGINFAAYSGLANGTFTWYNSVLGTASQTPWMGTGSHLQLSITATGQIVTARYAGSWVIAGLLRAPDQ